MFFCGGYFSKSEILKTIKEARETNQELYLTLFPRHQSDENERLFFRAVMKYHSLVEV